MFITQYRDRWGEIVCEAAGLKLLRDQLDFLKVSLGKDPTLLSPGMQHYLSRLHLIMHS